MARIKSLQRFSYEKGYNSIPSMNSGLTQITLRESKTLSMAQYGNPESQRIESSSFSQLSYLLSEFSVILFVCLFVS